MDEYIEREAATNVACNILWKMNDLSTSVMAKALNSIPAADVAPVRHGYWRPILHKDGKADYECSCCLGIIMDVPDDDEHDLCAWCSMCGAKMDGGFDNG